MRSSLLATLVLFAAIFALAIARATPPGPLPKDAPREVFSALRAREIQAGLVHDGASRRVGSAEGARAREFLGRELARLGYAVETQRSFACNRHGTCGEVVNVVGRREGSVKDATGILLVAHYDSVPAAAGASDDGLGTAAVLETARALGEGPRPKRPVVVLLTDGEEGGLLGAEAFVREHPLAKSVKAAVNVDARGSSGPSALFETSDESGWLVHLASRLERPFTSSLFYEVYRRMPNDTDFTAIKRVAAGFSLGNVGSIENYHTPLDRLETSDLGTLQHHGQNVLGLARALDDADINAPAPGKAVWFDVLSFFVVRWPASWTVALAALTLAFVVVQSIRMYAWGSGLLVAPASMAASIATTAGLGWTLGALGAVPTPWIASPVAALVAVHLAAFSAAALVMVGFGRRASPRSMWAGAWIAWALLGLALASVAPGASYLFVVPAAVAAVFAPLPFRATCILPAAAAAVLWFPLASPLYDALGLVLAPLPALPTIVLATTLAPMVPGERPRLPLVGFAGTALVALVALFVAPFSTTHPQRVNVAFRQDDEGPGRVFVEAAWGYRPWGKPPPSMMQALGPVKGDDFAMPHAARMPFAETTRIDAVPPEAILLDGGSDRGRRRVHARVRSRRSAPTVFVTMPSGRSVDVKYKSLPVTPRSGTLVLLAVPPEGVEIELDASGSEPIAVGVLDLTYDVPEGLARAVQGARPPQAIPTQEGDVTVVGTVARL